MDCCGEVYVDTENLEAKARQRSKHNGVQGNAPSNRGSYDGLARNNVARQIFSLKAAVQLLIAVVFLVVVGIEIFQHLNRALGKRGIDVVEVENIKHGGHCI